MFRRNQEGSTTPWNAIDASLHQVYIAGQKEKVIVPCAHCHETDNSSLECAVLTVLPRPQQVAHDKPPSWKGTARHLQGGNGPPPTLARGLSATPGMQETANSQESVGSRMPARSAMAPIQRWYEEIMASPVLGRDPTP